MASNGCWYKKPGWIVSVLAGLAVLVGGYSVMGYQVGDHEKRITTIEADDKTFKLDYTEQMTRMEERQRTITENISDINDNIQRIADREPGGAEP